MTKTPKFNKKLKFYEEMYYGFHQWIKTEQSGICCRRPRYLLLRGRAKPQKQQRCTSPTAFITWNCGWILLWTPRCQVTFSTHHLMANPNREALCAHTPQVTQLRHKLYSLLWRTEQQRDRGQKRERKLNTGKRREDRYLVFFPLLYCTVTLPRPSAACYLHRSTFCNSLIIKPIVKFLSRRRVHGARMQGKVSLEVRKWDEEVERERRLSH